MATLGMLAAMRRAIMLSNEGHLEALRDAKAVLGEWV